MENRRQINELPEAISASGRVKKLREEDSNPHLTAPKTVVLPIRRSRIGEVEFSVIQLFGIRPLVPLGRDRDPVPSYRLCPLSPPFIPGAAAAGRAGTSGPAGGGQATVPGGAVSCNCRVADAPCPAWVQARASWTAPSAAEPDPFIYSPRCRGASCECAPPGCRDRPRRG